MTTTATTRRPLLRGPWRSSPSIRFALVALIAWLFYLPTVRGRNLGDCGGSSRLATAESLVELGRFAIDYSSFAYTCDTMMIDGLLYSDKPPVLSVVAAAVYGMLHHGFGLRLAGDWVSQSEARLTYGLMIALIVLTCQALLVATFDHAVGRLGWGALVRLALTASMATATLLWPLSALFNSHTVAAAGIFIGLVLAVPGGAGAAGSRPALGGLALGLAAVVDIPLGGLALAVGWLASPGRWRLLLGALTPLLLHGALNLWIVGDLVPFQLHRELYNELTGHTGESATGFAQDRGLVFYAGRNLFGALGVFSLTPLLGVALVLAVAGVMGSSRSQPPGRKPDAAEVATRRWSLAAIALFLAGLVLYTAVWPDAVGCSYGMRHLTPVTAPVLLAGLGAIRSRRALGAYLVAALLSAMIAAVGLLYPTTCAGFERPAHGYVPAYVLFDNLREFLLR